MKAQIDPSEPSSRLVAREVSTLLLETERGPTINILFHPIDGFR